MNFYKACKKFFESEGYKYLGHEAGLVFYKDEFGKSWGSSEESVAGAMIEKGFWN